MARTETLWCCEMVQAALKRTCTPHTLLQSCPDILVNWASYSTLFCSQGKKRMQRNTPITRWHEDGTSPEPGSEVFVFGSNLAGIHGAGAAQEAASKFGAVYGCAKGWQPLNQSYAIPTKDRRLHTLPLSEIKLYIDEFVRLTQSSFVLNSGYWVTRVGCGLAGYQDHEIAPLFRGAQNCSFPLPWRQYLESSDD